MTRLPFSLSGAVLVGLLGIAGYVLWTDYAAYLTAYLPWIVLAACPLMHLFMHRGYGGHTHNGTDERSRRSPPPNPEAQGGPRSTGRVPQIPAQRPVRPAKPQQGLCSALLVLPRTEPAAAAAPAGPSEDATGSATRQTQPMAQRCPRHQL